MFQYVGIKVTHKMENLVKQNFIINQFMIIRAKKTKYGEMVSNTNFAAGRIS